MTITILALKKRGWINVFNNGYLYRDFTCIDDVVGALVRLTWYFEVFINRSLWKGRVMVTSF